MTDGFFGARGDSFAAQDADELRASLAKINATLPTEGLRAEHRERYCIVHYLRTLEQNELIEFPFRITWDDSPDFRIEMGSRIFGLEHTDAGHPKYREAAAYFKRKAPRGSELEGHKVRKPGEPSSDRGYIGDEAERMWTQDVLRAIVRKSEEKLPGYQTLPAYELLLFDDSEHSAETQWTVTELPGRLAAAIQEWREAEPGGERHFSRISVLRDRVLMYDVTASALLLPVPASATVPPLLPVTRLGVSEEALHAFCRNHHIRKLGFFGSVSEDSDRFGPKSDVDVLVEFEPDHRIGLIQLAGVELELCELLGREVDLRTVPDLSRYFREQVVREKTDLAYAHAAG